MRHFVRLLAILAFLATNGEAAIYHVKKAGNDSYSCAQAQNPATPKRTISSAFACIGVRPAAGAGHTVRVYAGTYVEYLNNNMPGGLSDKARFVLEGNPGDLVVLKPSNAGAAMYWAGDKHKYITVSNLVLDGINSRGYGIFGDRGVHHIRVQDVESKNWSQQGIYLTGSFHHLVSVHVHHNGSTKCTHSSSAYCHGLYLAADDSIVEYSLFHNNSGLGTHVYRSSGSTSRNIQRFNVSHSNHVGFLHKGSSNIMHNNISYNNTTAGIVVTSGGKVFNNTIYGTRRGHCVQNHYGTLEARNNICFKNSNNSIACFSGGNCTKNVSHNLFSDPLFVDPANGDFRVWTGSPAIDAGATILDVTHDITGIPRLENFPYDIGAHEAGSLP